jgi:thiosulfate dehydrogenase [quinone] large subunit
MNSVPISSVSTDPKSTTEQQFAFGLLRLFLGLRTLFAGIEKFEAGGRYSFAQYYQNMGRMAEGITGASFLPLWATKTFALALGYLLILLGGALLLGVKPRITLFALGLLYTALAFGLMVVQEAEGVAWLGIHVGLIAAALMLVRHSRFVLWR